MAFSVYEPTELFLILGTIWSIPVYRKIPTRSGIDVL